MGMVDIRPYILVPKLMKTKTRFLRCTGYINSIKTYRARFIANSCFCTTTELSKSLTSCLMADKNMVLSTVKRYMKDPVRIYFCLLKFQVKFKIYLKLVISMQPDCLQRIFYSLPHNLI